MKKIKNLKDICAVSSNTIDDNYVGIMFKNDEVSFESFLWIINDYLNNGLYSDKEKMLYI